MAALLNALKWLGWTKSKSKRSARGRLTSTVYFRWELSARNAARAMLTLSWNVNGLTLWKTSENPHLPTGYTVEILIRYLWSFVVYLCLFNSINCCLHGWQLGPFAKIQTCLEDCMEDMLVWMSLDRQDCLSQWLQWLRWLQKFCTSLDAENGATFRR